ncbi:hypothetical protein O3P69_000515 [Scylla paramamosain]|uniref:Secreted protein n=1 Tax=Scylla paramamosain TaxID=85552 RepID=A0AAW0UYQ4_SCYPA
MVLLLVVVVVVVVPSVVKCNAVAVDLFTQLRVVSQPACIIEASILEAQRDPWVSRGASAGTVARRHAVFVHPRVTLSHDPPSLLPHHNPATHAFPSLGRVGVGPGTPFAGSIICVDKGNGPSCGVEARHFLSSPSIFYSFGRKPAPLLALTSADNKIWLQRQRRLYLTPERK